MLTLKRNLLPLGGSSSHGKPVSSFVKNFGFLLSCLCLTVLAIFPACKTVNQQNHFEKDLSKYSESIFYNESIAFVKLFFTDIDREKRYSAQGTAFAINENFLLTAGHVCDIPNDVVFDEIKLKKINKYGVFDPDLEKEKSAIIISIHEFYDACLLYSKQHGFKPLKMARTLDHVYSGDVVFSVGCPGGLPYVKEFGTVVMIGRGEEERKEVVLNLKINKGFSGAPVIRNNEVIGLVYAYWDVSKYREISFAVSSEILVEFFENTIGVSYCCY